MGVDAPGGRVGSEEEGAGSRRRPRATSAATGGAEGGFVTDMHGIKICIMHGINMMRNIKKNRDYSYLGIDT